MALPLPTSTHTSVLCIVLTGSCLLDTDRGVYLTDLVFIEDGNPDESEGLVNFYKVCAPPPLT